MSVPTSARVRNGLVLFVLRSPLHRLADRALVAITVMGRRSGRERSLPVMYAREGGTLWILVGWAERKRWWRNLQDGPQEVRLVLRGRRMRTRANVLMGARGEAGELLPGLWCYLRRFPKAAGHLGIDTGADGSPEPASVADYARTAVMVRCEPS